MNASGTGAAFRERSNLACLATTALIYPAILALALAAPTPVSLPALLAVGVALQVGVLIVVHALLALSAREEPDDERIVAIERRADRLSGTVLGVGVMLVIGLTIVQGFAAPADTSLMSSPILTGYALFACFVGAELVRMSIAAIGYRRG